MQQTVVTLTNSVYSHLTGQLIEAAFLSPYLFPDRNIFPTPEIGLAMTNRVQCVMIDEQTQRVIDYVNLDNLVTRMDLTQELLGLPSVVWVRVILACSGRPTGLEEGHNSPFRPRV